MFTNSIGQIQRRPHFIFLSLLFLAFFSKSSAQDTIERFTSNEMIPPHKEVVKLSLSSGDFGKTFGDLLMLFKQADIYVVNNSKVKRKQNELRELKFQLLHDQGLNLKLRITKFSEVDFQFAFDEVGQCLYFTYRIDNDEVYQHIKMNTRGYKTYDCFDTIVVERGTTNHDIVRAY